MEKNTINVDWKGGMAFSTEINGHQVSIDATEEFGGNSSAPNPKPLMMMALAGCTGIDVVSILNKMQVPLDDFSIEVESTMTEEHPKVYTGMHLIYTFKGKDLNPKKLQRAIDLSMEKYCGVSAMYQEAMEISHEMKIEGNYL